MVIKPISRIIEWGDMFESNVISYGNQTLELRQEFRRKFESGVISYGNQT